MKKIYHFLKCHSLCLSFSSCLTVEAIFFFFKWRLFKNGSVFKCEALFEIQKFRVIILKAA